MRMSCQEYGYVETMSLCLMDDSPSLFSNKFITFSENASNHKSIVAKVAEQCTK